ncbi:MAG TPA: ABC transporter permease [Mycobacteriales bacterium]|nr:ABC transporter permease [Mycobacteriales bacterium]
MPRRDHSFRRPAWLTLPRLGIAASAVAAAALLVVADRLEGGLPLPFTQRSLPAGILVLGLVVGSLDALLGMGLVVLYRAGRFINFAQGQLGAFAAAFGIALSQFYEKPLALGILAGFAAAALLAALSELAVVRRLFDAPRLIVTVATIGLAQVYAALTLAVPGVFDRNLNNAVTIDVGPEFVIRPVRFEGGSILTLIVVPLVCLALVGLFRTSLGTSIRAVAENPGRARLLGISVRRVSTYTWVIAGLLAATTGVLRAVNPSAGFSYGVIEGPSFILNGLTAAVIGGMTSLPVTFVAALALGALEQSVLFVTGDSGDTNLAVFAVLLVALLLRRRQVGRAADARRATGFVAVRAVRPMPEAIARLSIVRAVRWGGGALLVLLLALLPALLGPSNLDLANSIVLVAMVALSLTILTGYGGQVSLGQWALVGVGATVGAVLVERGIDFGVGLLLVVALGALVAVAIGLPALRVPGLFLAVTTLTFAVAVDTWLLKLDSLQLEAPKIVRPLLFSVFDLTSGAAYYEFSLVALGLTVLVVRRLRQGPAGRDLVAVRDNSRAAAAYGIREGRTKLAAFAVSGAIAAAAGYLYAFQQELLTESAFSDRISLQVFTIVVIGGLGSIPGALLGTVYVLCARFYLDEGFQFAATGIGLLALLLFVPEGVGGLVFRARDAAVRRLAARRSIELPSAAALIAPAVEEAT